MTNVSQFDELRADRIYRDTDVVYRIEDDRSRFDMVVSPDGDPGAIELALSGVNRIRAGADGAVVASVDAGDVELRPPFIYQDIDRSKAPVSGGFVISGARTVSRSIGDYDRNRELIIDPTVAFATYLGAGRAETIADIEIDANDEIYVTGSGTDFFDPNGDTLNVYIAKVSRDGTQLLFQTTFGGTGWAGFQDQDLAYGITTESSGHSWVVGRTNSVDFPTTLAAYDVSLGPVQGAQTDGFMTRFMPLGFLTYSSYLGGNGLAQARAAAIASDSLLITGGEADADFTTTANAFDRDCGADGDNVCDPPGENADAFLMRFDGISTGVLAVGYATYIGGQPIICDPGSGPFEIRDGREEGLDIETDALGRAYVFGITTSSDDPRTASIDEGFPVRNGYVVTYDVNICDINDRPTQNQELFLSIFDTTQAGDASLIYSTFIGGDDRELPGGIDIEADCDIDANCSVYVTGSTESADMLHGLAPPNSPWSDTLNGREDVFVLKVDPYTSGPAGLRYFSLIGGSSFERDTDIAIRRSCIADCPAYVAGFTNSTDFPQRQQIPSDHSAANDMFVTKFFPDASWFS